MLRHLMLIGDVHTEATRLARVLDHAAAGGVDAVLCVGDIVDGDEDPLRCLELLRDRGVVTVRGNHERWLLAGQALDPFEPPGWARAWVDALPETRELDTVAGWLLLCHGVGRHDMVRLLPEDRGYALDSNLALAEVLSAGRHRLMVGGHTHQRMVRGFGDLLVLNPGTLCRRDRPGCLEVDLEAGVGRWYRVELDGLVADGEVSLAAVPREAGPRGW